MTKHVLVDFKLDLLAFRRAHRVVLGVEIREADLVGVPPVLESNEWGLSTRIFSVSQARRTWTMLFATELAIRRSLEQPLVTSSLP